MKKIIYFFYACILFFIPIVLWPFTSEVFEFNKTVLLYISTIVIVSVWIIRMFISQKVIFRRTLLDYPILLFLGAMLLSTLFSVDFFTSLLGYYSRFNGGFLTLLCYSLLYWGFVSNLEEPEANRLIKVHLISSSIVAIYGVLEHFGIDKDIWVQDVQSRVFSTLGQPNWLAAWMAATIPLVWAYFLNQDEIKKKYLIYFPIASLFYWTLLFTKSRSGLLSLIVAFIVFWIFNFKSGNLKAKKSVVGFFVISISLVAISLISGTQWSPSLYSLFNSQEKSILPSTPGTVLESGGTESGAIRKIVWEGAYKIWLNYPILGTGPETFAYTYYLYRPVAHNQTSEWDFVYNKAHNEFLNYAANTGLLGLLTYLVLTLCSIIVIIKSKPQNKYLKQGLAAGLIGLSVSNFFGFSVVPTQIQFFLFPAVAVSLSLLEVPDNSRKPPLTFANKIFVISIVLIAVYLIIACIKYWQADVLYARGKAQNSQNRPDLAIHPITEAVKSQPYQAIYYSELGISYASLAIAFDQSKDSTSSAKFTELSVASTQKAISLSPANPNIYRQAFGIYVRLSTVNEEYLTKAREILIKAITLAPTDPKLFYNLGIANANLGDNNNAILNFRKAIELKPNYLDARIQYAALLAHLNRAGEARSQLQYVLQADPANEVAKQAIENLK